MKLPQGPIGVFDSGYGGLTVLKELEKQMPEYDYLYLGDNARTPYGTRSFEVVYEFTLQAVKALFGQGCNLVILACNTASAKALRSIQINDLAKNHPDKRVLGVLRPSTESLGDMSASKHVGILATTGTVKSASYSIELKKFFPELTVTEQACPMWVPLIENREHLSEAGKLFIQADVDRILTTDPKIDTIALACTHYPFVMEYVQSLLPNNVKVFAQGDLVARKLKDYLNRHKSMDESCSKGHSVRFLTTDIAASFEENASFFYGRDLKAETIRL